MRIGIALAVATIGCAPARHASVVVRRPAEPVAPAARVTDPIDIATDATMAALQAGAFDAIVGAFDPDLGAAPTIAQITKTWTSKTRDLGALVRWSIVDRTRQDGFDTRIVMLDLERGQLECLLTLVPDTHRIASLFLAKPAPPAPYVTPSRFVERPIVVGAGTEFPLDGTLTVPAGDGPFPGVVLVHGSGPNDRDSTVGANKIFKDLAEGLASAGIATLRYDKRTFRYEPTSLTLDVEVVDDAVLATHLLAAMPAIDPRRVFVIGHSLGGLLAPEIAVRATAVAGTVLLAPPARAPWEIILGQMRYLSAPAATIKAIELAITVINIGGGEGQKLVGIPFAYWRDWASRDGVAMVKQLGKPVLVLHGDRDYQVLDEDIAIWRDGLANVRDVEIATIHGDNHLFIRGSGPPSPLEYKDPAHVDARVIDRLVTFVRAH